MIKLTSDLDFKLTKKRFLMMGNQFSKKRARLAIAVLLPAFVITTFAFCTKTAPTEYWFPEYRLLYSNTKPALYRNVSDQRIYSEVTGERAVFSGTAKSYDWQTNLVKFEHIIEDGLYHEQTIYDSVGNLYSRTYYSYTDTDSGFAKIGWPKEALYFSSRDSIEKRTHYTYTGPEEKFTKQGSPKETLTFDSNGTLIQKMVYSYPSPDLSKTNFFRILDGVEILIYESSSLRGENTSEITSHGYFENGDLQFHSTITSNSDSGEIESKITEWDENGDILRYEHKVNDEIIEEINNGEEG